MLLPNMADDVYIICFLVTFQLGDRGVGRVVIIASKAAKRQTAV